VITQNEIGRLENADAYDRDGDKIGSVGQVYLDTQSGEPEWVTVKTGLFGTKESFVPLLGASFDGDRLTVATEKARVKDAPRIETDRALSYAEERELYHFYGITGTDDAGSQTGHESDRSGSHGSDGATGYAGDRSDGRAGDGTTGYAGDRSGGYESDGYESDRGGDHRADRADRDQDERDHATDRATGRATAQDSGRATAQDTGRATAQDTGRATAQDTGRGDAMTRSEERLVTGTRTEQTGKARLRKYVVTEQQQVTVPVAREEVRLEREPITDADRGDAYDGPDITESEHEVTLHAERPVVDTEAVPVERVRLGTETVRDEQSVSGEVRKEQIDYDGPDTRTGR
jgi:uncharacterized protein (TIGR02271 family)